MRRWRQRLAWLGVLALALITWLAPGQDGVPTQSCEAPAAPQNNLVYEIFVRSFCEGDNDSKHVGDLPGITTKLDSTSTMAIQKPTTTWKSAAYG